MALIAENSLVVDEEELFGSYESAVELLNRMQEEGDFCEGLYNGLS